MAIQKVKKTINKKKKNNIECWCENHALTSIHIKMAPRFFDLAKRNELVDIIAM